MPMMTCPKCGVEQNASDECTACGIVIEKYRRRMAAAAVEQDRDFLSEWGLYLQLPMGQQYMRFYPLKGAMIQRILEMGHGDLAMALCITATGVCLGIGALCRLFFVYRWLYHDRGGLVRYLAWPAGCALAGAQILVDGYAVTSQAGFVLMVVPVVFLCAHCFGLAAHVLPELNILHWPGRPGHLSPASGR
ncbi:MAG: hypothetical protein SWH68_13755 [Thermodesulfobacteriota bacterium]|nr:hypothetical protein [Thermodesulfobacteriota bacterium]